MRERPVILSPEAQDDLGAIEDYISASGSPASAMRYVERIGNFCARLAVASERGTQRNEIRPGLRVVGFERRIAIAFTVTSEAVLILRIFSGGVDWEDELSQG